MTVGVEFLADADSGNGLIDWIERFGANPWLLAIGLMIGTFISEDITCIAGGLFAAKGLISLPGAMAGCAVGIWLGDMVLYGVGYWVGHSRNHWKWLDRIVTEERVAKGRSLFDKYGVWWVLVARFLPGMRVPSYLAAGATGWSFRKFILVLALGAWIWVPVICGLSYHAGLAVLRWLESYQAWVWPILISLLLLIWIVVHFGIHLFSWRGRRILRARWIRLRRWEYWPVWAIYPPVILCLAWQAIRLRGLLLFTCCDPAIPHSGVALESKGEILDALDPPDESRVRLAKYLRLAPSADDVDRLERLETFLKEQELSYPVVLKPDIGERGKGVAIIRSREEAIAWLSAYHGPSILQEFVDGVEFGVLWSKSPGEQRGTISSICGKHPQHVTGDGVRTLEQLILMDPRALAMSRYYLRKYAEQLTTVPAEGERFVLAELGTHARGALFTDERSLDSEALREVLDEIGDRYEGFYLGRYDLRAPSVEDLSAGRNLVVLELNGVTGEPVHIYEPRYPWWKGIRDLCGHWKRACEIGAANRERGATPTPAGTLWALGRAHRKQRWFEADQLKATREEESRMAPVSTRPALKVDSVAATDE